MNKFTVAQDNKSSISSTQPISTNPQPNPTHLWYILCSLEQKTRGGKTQENIYSYNCEIFVCFRSYLFVRAPFEQKLKLLQRKAVGTPSRSGRDPSSIERMAGAQSCFSAGVDMSFSRGFCVGPYSFSYVRICLSTISTISVVWSFFLCRQSVFSRAFFCVALRGPVGTLSTTCGSRETSVVRVLAA